MKSHQITFTVLLSFLFACSGGTAEEQEGNEEKGKEERIEKGEVEALQEEVIGIHDEVMPRMGELQEWKRKAKGKADSLRDKGKEEAARRMEELSVQMARAHESMMEWMRQFEKPDPQDRKQAIEYLEKQKLKVKAMRDTMLNALEKAERKLGKED